MAARDELLVMSVTRLGSGICAAGVDHQHRWIRPTRENARGWRQLEVSDLCSERGEVVVRVGNVVHWPVGDPIPQDIHTEDCRVSQAWPVFLRRLTLTELLACCQALAEQNLAGFIESADRSLILVKPSAIREVLFDTGGKEGVRAQVRFVHGNESYEWKVTDLAWRALGRRLLREQQVPELTWSAYDLQQRQKMRIVYLAIGRGREFQGAYWPFITTVITQPPNDEPIDYVQT